MISGEDGSGETREEAMEGNEGGEHEEEESGLGGLKIGSVYSLPVENQWENNEGESSQDQKDLTLQQFGKVTLQNIDRCNV